MVVNVRQDPDISLGESPPLGSRDTGHAVMCFDETQITSPTNRSQPEYGKPSHPLTATGRPPSVAFRGGNTAGPLDISTAINAKGGNGRMDFESETFLVQQQSSDVGSPSLPRVASHGDVQSGAPAIVRGGGVRRLTPVECERLQGFPDDYTRVSWRGKGPDLCPDGHRYKALGNSMAVPVMRWIGERIALVDLLSQRSSP